MASTEQPGPTKYASLISHGQLAKYSHTLHYPAMAMAIPSHGYGHIQPWAARPNNDSAMKRSSHVQQDPKPWAARYLINWTLISLFTYELYKYSIVGHMAGHYWTYEWSWQWLTWPCLGDLGWNGHYGYPYLVGPGFLSMAYLASRLTRHGMWLCMASHGLQETVSARHGFIDDLSLFIWPGHLGLAYWP